MTLFKTVSWDIFFALPLAFAREPTQVLICYYSMHRKVVVAKLTQITKYVCIGCFLIAFQCQTNLYLACRNNLHEGTSLVSREEIASGVSSGKAGPKAEPMWPSGLASAQQSRADNVQHRL